MTGRDPREVHRAATPLELLYDLTFVVAFGAAGNEAAHFFAEGHWRAGSIGLAFAMFAVIWAWIQNTWFASAYDTDDWIYRLLTMVQMVGVLVLALGLPPMFESIDHGEHVDNSVMVLGYVIMRVGLVALWLRVAHHDAVRRRCAYTYVITLVIAQIGWIGLLVAQTSIGVMFSVAAVLVVIELSGPVIAERRFGVTTPWHPHHIAERYGLLTIITLGEVILGTVAALDAVVRLEGWTTETALVGLAGVGLAFGMWWMYFVIPSADLLDRHRYRVVRLGLRAHPALRRPRRDRRRVARGRLVPRARGAHQPARRGADDRGATGHLRDLPLRAVQRAHPGDRSVPPVAARRHGGGHRRGDRHGRRRRCRWPRACSC